MVTRAGAPLRNASTSKTHPSFIAAALLFVMVTVPCTADAATLVVDNDAMAAVNNCDAATPAFPTISLAVTAASPGDTIQVCPGLYIENITLAKSLILKGAKAGVDARGRVFTVESESFVTPPVPAMPILSLQTGSAGSVIDGFALFGGTRTIESFSGPIHDLQILNNLIQGFSNNAIFLNNDGINITVRQNEINGAAKIGTAALFHLDQDNFDGFWFIDNSVINGLSGAGFFVDGNRNVDKSTPGARPPQFSGNFIDLNGTGANLGRFAWGDGDITGNTFSDNRFDGLQGGPRNARIEDNWFDNNGRDGLALTGFGGAGDPTRGAQGNTITLNCFTRNGLTMAGAGILFSSGQFPGTISTNVANKNNIVANATGLRYLGFESINAIQNWWGSPTGPFHPSNPTGTGNAVVDNGTVNFDPWRTTGVPGTPCGGGPAAELVLEPEAATNPVSSTHCVTATVFNQFGIPLEGVTVEFSVVGSVTTSGIDETDSSGQAEFCYTGPDLPGADAITAFADSNGSGAQDPGEPFDTASKTWVLPLTTPGCEIIITNGGWIIANNGDRGSFGGNAKSDGDGNVSGQEQYQDHGPADPFNLHGTPMVITCSSETTQATIFGDATINGTGSHTFRIDVRDIGEPGKGVDRYRIQVEDYDSGDQTLQGGNVQIKREQ